MAQEDYVQILQTLEPVFFEAGKLAVKLQKDSVPETKLGTGIYDLDVVTDADIAVQEMILSAVSKTALSQCRLVAEERTELADKFDRNGEFLFAVDPIDGTSFYVDGGRMYSLIVSLQSPGLPIYTFAHYPVIGWTHRFIGTTYHEEGRRPEILIKETGKIIAYSYGDPKVKIPDSEIKKIETLGYNFVNRKLLTTDCGSTAMLLCETVDGYYCENPPTVDGLVGLHYGLTHNCEIHSTLQKEWPKSGLGGMRYHGYYFVIRK